MKPTIGRIVHFHDNQHAAPYGPGPFAAIVMAVDGTTVTLWVLFPAPGSPREITNVPFERASGVYWAWPPRED